jgi:zinc protease
VQAKRHLWWSLPNGYPILQESLPTSITDKLLKDTAFPQTFRICLDFKHRPRLRTQENVFSGNAIPAILFKPRHWMHLEAKRLTTKYRASKMFSPYKILPVRLLKTTAISMNISLLTPLFRKIVAAVCVTVLIAMTNSAQVPMEPQHERLLNGLRILIWSQPGNQDVLLKLRIHSGAAFDLSGKEGTMALLGDMLFPDPTTREYFTEEMQGRLNVSTDYDAITITLQGRANQFDRIVEILRTALVTTQITPENINKMRDARIKVVKETAVSPSVLADRAIAARMFGDFPYGRPYAGTVESLTRIERADLLLAKERFLNPNNATLVIIGGVPPVRTVRTLRQVLGNWRKSEQVVPSTFRQPGPPDARTLIVNSPSDQSIEVRLAVRGLARNDADAATVAVLANLARQRWIAAVTELNRSPVFVRHESFTLPGIFVMGATVDNVLAGKALTAAREAIKTLASNPVTPAELAQAKSDVMTQANKDLSNPDGIANAWLDGDTFGLSSLAERMRALNNVTQADVQRVATRLVANNAFASVALGNSEVLKAQSEKFGKVEVLGEIPPKLESKSDPKPHSGDKPQVKNPAKPE